MQHAPLVPAARKLPKNVTTIRKSTVTALTVLGVVLAVCTVISLSLVGALWERVKTQEASLKHLESIVNSIPSVVNLSTSVVGLLNESSGGTGESTYTSGELLIGNDVGGLSKSTLSPGTNIDITNGNGTITVNLDGTVPTGNGGTGQTTYTNGQLLIGNSVGNTLTKAKLTAGVGIIITNGPGSIVIGATGTDVTLVGGTNIAIDNDNDTITVGLTGTIDTANGGTGENTYSSGQLLIGNTAGTLTKNTLTAGTNTAITNGNGTITIGLTGVVPELHGGTGESTYTSGQLLIGNNAGGLSKNTLTAGQNIGITNGNGAITIGLTGAITVPNGGTGETSYNEGELLIGNSLGGLSKNTLTPGTNIDISNDNGTITIGLAGTVPTTIGGTGQTTYTNGQLLIGNAGGGLSKNTLTAGTNIGITNGNGAVTVGITGTIPVLHGGNGFSSYTNGQVLIGNSLGSLSRTTLTAGTNIAVTNGDGSIGIGLTGTVGTANGGTGQTTYTNGQLLIGSSVGNTLAKATLTAGTGISITNGPGTITVSATGVNITLVGGTNIDVSTVGSTVTVGLVGTVATGNGGTGQTTYTNGQLLIGNAGGSLTKNTLTAGTNIGITNGNGAITVGLTGTVASGSGGTGQTTYTNGQLLIGNSVSSLTKATLTAGTNIGITNGDGSITVGLTGTIAVGSGGTGLGGSYTNGQLLIGNAGGGLTKATLSFGQGISIINGNGAISISLAIPVDTAYGGTGQTTYTSGQILVGEAGGTLEKRTIQGGTNIQITYGIGTVAFGLTGTVATANGGTGHDTYTNGQLLIGSTSGGGLSKSTLTAGAGISITNGAGSITIASALKYWVFVEQQAVGVNAGNSVNGFQTRVLNTVQTNGGSDVTLDTVTGIMTFAAGTYSVNFRAPGFGLSHQAILRRTAGGALMFCSSEIAATGTQTHTVCSGYLTFASTDTIELRQYTNAVVTNGLGKAYGTFTEVYSVGSITRIL